MTSKRREEQSLEPAPEVRAPRPSRSQKKRDAEALADLGRLLTKLKRTLVLQMPLDEEVRAAVLSCQSMEKNAHARQLRHIAKLLAGVDIEPTLSTLRQYKLLR